MPHGNTKKSDFKICSVCGHAWKLRDEFLKDPFIELVGYQANFLNPSRGLFLFVHRAYKCGAHLTLRVENFDDLFRKEKYYEARVLSDECPVYCMEANNLEFCIQPCKMAYVREILQIIRKIKKGEKKLLFQDA